MGQSGRTENRNLFTWLPLQSGLETGCRDRETRDHCLSSPPLVLFVHPHSFIILLSWQEFKKDNYKDTLKKTNNIHVISHSGSEIPAPSGSGGSSARGLQVWGQGLASLSLYLVSEEDSTSQLISGCWRNWVPWGCRTVAPMSLTHDPLHLQANNETSNPSLAFPFCDIYLTSSSASFSASKGSCDYTGTT